MRISLTASTNIWRLVLLFYVVNDIDDDVYTGCYALRHFFASVKSLLFTQELLKRTDMRPHVLNLRKNLTFEHGTCKTGTFSYFWQYLT